MMNEFFEENKKMIVTVGVVIAFAIVFAVVNIFIGNDNKKMKPEDALKELGTIYYEELYYPQLKSARSDDYTTILTNYSKDGLKVTLASLVAVIDNLDIDNFINEKDNTSCDFYETYIVIYPNGNLTEKDYTIEVNTKCDVGFSTEEENVNEGGK